MTVLLALARNLGNVARHPRLFLAGWQEAHLSSGVTYDDDPTSRRSAAYDTGRNLRTWGRA